jgi:hypothetical protein
MSTTTIPRGPGRPVTVWLTLLLAGCHAPNPPGYQDGDGFHFTPPPGWVERARGDAMPAGPAHKQQNVPLPPLGIPGHPPERLLVRYDRLTGGPNAWLRVSVADLPSSTPLKACLSSRTPGQGWKWVSQEESLEVSGSPAAVIASQGRWYDRDYLCETVAVRKGEKVYLFSAAYPAADDTAHEQIRQAILQANW